MANKNQEALNWFYGLSGKEQLKLEKKHLRSKNDISIGTIQIMYDREVNGVSYTPIKRPKFKNKVNFEALSIIYDKINKNKPLDDKDRNNLSNFILMISKKHKFAIISHNILKDKIKERK